MAYFREIGVEPAEENPGNIAVREVAECERPNRQAASDVEPQGTCIRSRALIRDGGVRPGFRGKPLPDERLFSCRCIRVLFRSVPGDEVPDGAHQASHERAEPERCSPAMMGDNPGEQGWSQPRSGSHAGKDPPVGSATLT